MKFRKRTIQFVSITLINAAVLYSIAVSSDELKIQSIGAAVGVAAVFITSQLLFWWLFADFFSYLPVLFYPLITLVMAGGIFMILGNLIPGVLIANVTTSIWITLILTLTNAILSSLFSLDMESKFDSNVTLKLVERRGKPIFTDTPGFIFLEIDGLGEAVFRRALAGGRMPAVQRWMVEQGYKIQGWETDFTSQTCAMQAGILMGNNENIPAYRWWSRSEQRVIVSGNPRDAEEIEKRETTGRGLLAYGGASRGNMFSGDASESLLTMGTMLDARRIKGPGFYLYLFSPFIIARLITRFFTGVFREWWQSLRQRLRKDKYIVSSRNFFYAFYRAAVGPFLQDLNTYIVISDVLRGRPAIYAMYGAYDDIGHYAGMESPEALQALEEIDRYFSRIERALKNAPRPYHIVILSDHGQSTGPTFHSAYGLTLEHLVKGSVRGESKVFASLETNETWDNINAFLNESINANTRTAQILRSLLRRQTQNGLLAFGPERSRKKVQRNAIQAQEAHLVVLASGCTGLIYFVGTKNRLTYEEIRDRYPELILNLALHPGIGFVLVRSNEHGDMVMGKGGINFLDRNLVEGEDPLSVYSSNFAGRLKRESSFDNCPDIIVNTRYDAKTGELCAFENQVSHHGGLGGNQNYPFIFYPPDLPAAPKQIIGATGVYHVLKGWRDAVQSSSAPPDSNN